MEKKYGSMDGVTHLENNHLLIIGGTGFIGLHVVREGLKRGFKVTVLSKNSLIASSSHQNVKYLKADISSYDDLHAELKNETFNYVVNLCGYINHSNYFDNGDEVINVHLNGTINIVDILNKKHLVSFVQIGSSDEYGNNPAPQNESMRELPISPYSFAKVASTQFLQMLNLTQNFPVVILRPFLVFGPGQKMNRFLPQVINGCLNDDDFPVSSGEQLRDFCYIDDLVEAIFLSFDNPKTYGEVINIASGNPVSIKEVISLIQKIIGLGRPKFGEIPYRVGENMALYADTTKAKQMLNWAAKTTLYDGIKKTIENQKIKF